MMELDEVQAAVFTLRPAPNYELLYADLLSACARYFSVDIEDDELTTAYDQIFEHMTKSADKVKVQ